MRASRSQCPGNYRVSRSRQGNADRFGNQAKANLSATGELDVDLGQKLRIKQRAMLDPMTSVDAKAYAQGVEAVLGTRMPRAGKHQRVDHPLHPDRQAPAPCELGVEEAEVEPRIVSDQRRIFDEIEQLLR